MIGFGLRDYIYLAVIGALLVGGGVERCAAVEDAHEQGKLLAEGACAVANNAARTEQLDDWTNTQSTIDLMASLSVIDMAARLSQIESNTSGLVKSYRNLANAKPLPDGCVLDPDRVRAINDARGGRSRPAAD